MGDVVAADEFVSVDAHAGAVGGSADTAGDCEKKQNNGRPIIAHYTCISLQALKPRAHPCTPYVLPG